MEEEGKVKPPAQASIATAGSQGCLRMKADARGRTMTFENLFFSSTFVIPQGNARHFSVYSACQNCGNDTDRYEQRTRQP